MLTLNKIILTHFKNYNTQKFDFNRNVVGICGLNGKGKTNLLDAIYYSCFTRSYFSVADALNIQFNQVGFRLETFFTRREEDHTVVCINRGNKKELYLNAVPYEKFSKHIGFLPVVMIAPDDIELITAGSEGRRRFLDTVLSQIDPGYLQHLILYNKILLQRNSLLKNYYKQADANELLDILDQQLVLPGTTIFEKRKAFLKELIPLVIVFYNDIAGSGESVQLEYNSHLHLKDVLSLFKSSLEKDILLQRSTTGIHKDDIEIKLNNQVFKHTASQGQRKSLLFALKLAEYVILKKYKGFSPLLLLDDVFEKLDDNRMKNLLRWVCNENSGQVFITDTHRVRLQEAFDQLGVEGQIIELN